jgi:hypothetical protein
LDGEIPWEVNVDPFKTAGGTDPTKSSIQPNIPDFGQATPGTGVIIKKLPIQWFSTTHVKGTLIPNLPDKSGGIF